MLPRSHRAVTPGPACSRFQKHVRNIRLPHPQKCETPAAWCSSKMSCLHARIELELEQLSLAGRIRERSPVRRAASSSEGGEDIDGWCRVAGQREGSAGDAEVRDGLPVRRRRDRDGGRDPGAVPAGAGAGQLDGHCGAGLDPGGVHLQPGLFCGCGLQPEGVADPQDRDHPGRRGGLHRVGPPGRRASAGRAGAGGGGDIGVGGADDLRLDGQAPGGLPPGGGRDPGRRGAGGDGRPGSGRAGRGDLRPVAARGRRRR